ncbi:MAG: ABC transporter ATP-binding protein [Parahaliea sp.]
MSLLQLAQVDLHYGPIHALDQLTLNLQAGEVLGLFGHNGAGKTTCMKLILGLLEASAGSVRVFGQPPQQADVRRQLGYLPENVMFYPQLSGRETLRHFARLKQVALSQVDELLAQVGLTDAADRRLKTYSKGMRQRLGLAQALLGRPRLLLLDEPTVGLDPIATQQLYEIIDGLRAEGAGIILCSHVLPGVEPYINRAAILAGGRLQAIGSLHELRQQVELPTRIRLHLADDLPLWQKHLQGSGLDVNVIGTDTLETCVRDDAGNLLIQQWLQSHCVVDLEVMPPSLDDLYRYFMAHTDSCSDVGPSAGELR